MTKRNTLQECVEYAEKRNGKCLSKEYKNNTEAKYIK